MKLLIVLGVIAVTLTHSGDCYDTKYDDFNVDELIDNDRLLESYCKCFLDEGKCTGEANDFKKWMPDATATACEQCTEKQKHLVAKTLAAIKAKLPTYYKKLRNRYDPEGKNADKIDDFLVKYNN